MVLLLLASATLVGGCGSGKKEGAEQPLGQAVSVGSASCLNCHTATPDVSGRLIGASWLMTTHTTVGNVQCEDCHGPGSLHWGLGPIPYPNPQPAQCEVCHPDLSTFNTTAHNNENQRPNSTFSQFTPQVASGVTPPNSSQHVQECSVCHNSSQQFSYNTSGVLVQPDPNNLPNPVVTCASCHDAHFAESRQIIAQRTDYNGVPYPNFRFYFQNMSTAQANPFSGAVINPRAQVAVGLIPDSARQNGFIFQPNGAVIPAAGVSAGTTTAPDFTKVVGTNNEIKPEIICAACHTKGTYLYSQTATHQSDVYTQWTTSGHGTRTEPPFAEFSANPPAYGDFSAGTGTHQSIWPFDMSINNSFGTLNLVGATAMSPNPETKQPGQNAAVASNTPGQYNNNFLCYKCHNGVTSLAWQDNVQGSDNAPVVFGDATVTCITCHNPHANVPGQSSNTRKPVIMTNYSETFPTSGTVLASLTFGQNSNVFLDNTVVPSTTGNATICVYCHQGRESGFTLFKLRLASNNTLAGTTSAYNFFNPHYLGTGAMLWARNGYEYPGNLYGQVTQHQNTNCFGCHMATAPRDVRNLVGSHTWKIVSDDDSVVNNATCNVAACHAGRVPVTNSSGQFDNFRDTVFDNPTTIPGNTAGLDYDGSIFNLSDPTGIGVVIANLENQLIALLNANNVFYSDTKYPYFFADAALTTQFRNWTLPTLKAAFNLTYVIKGLPSGPSQIGQPNMSAGTHNYRYNIELLQDSYNDLQRNGVAGQPDHSGFPRPSGSRPATNYDPQGGGGYNPRQ
jgi:hypothetical protein